MKKLMISFAIIILIATILHSENNSIIGNWLLTQAEENEELEDVYYIINFNNDGNIFMENEILGSWEYDNQAKTIIIKSEIIEEFSGTRTISRISDKHMILSSESSKLYFTKLDLETMFMDNNNSGLSGLWKIKNKDTTTYLSFSSADNLEIIYTSPEHQETSRGKWLYNKDDKTIIMMIRNYFFKGKNRIIRISKDKLIIEKNDETLTAVKILQTSKEMEQLDFTEKQITDSYYNEDEYAQSEESKLPWQNIQIQTSYLKNITQIEYKHSFSIARYELIDTEKIAAEVVYDQDLNEIMIDQIFGTLSEYHYENNGFYPLQQPDQFRIVTEEKITVQAGTFNCQVVESIDDYTSSKIRYYMIINRPGIYAKIVSSRQDFNGIVYDTYELTNIKSNLPTMKSSKIIGNWLLIKRRNLDRTTICSYEYDFINDGRLSINHND